MPLLIFKENIGAERLEEFTLIQPRKKERLVDTDVPCPQGADNPLMGGRATRCDERGSDG